MAKTKERKHTFADSGISIRDSITLSVNNRILPVKKLIVILMTFLGIFGSMYSFMSYFDFTYDKSTFLIYNLIFFAVFSVILNLPNRLKLFIIPICLLYETIFVRQRDNFINGFKAMYNVVAKTIHLTYGDIMYYRLDKSVDIADSTTIFFLLSSFLISLIVCYFTYCTSLFPFGIAITFFLVETGLYFGFTPSYPAFIMVLIYWIYLIANGFSGYHCTNGEKSAGFIRNGNKFYAKANIKFSVGELSGLTAALLSFVLFTSSIFITDYIGYERSEKINEIRNNVKTSVSEFSIDNIPDSMSKLAMSFGNFSAAPGKLGQFSNISFKNEVNLQASFDKKLDSEIYLKCFTGSYYLDNEWNDFPKETYKKYDSMFSEFEESGVFPQDFLSISSKYLPNSLQCSIKINSVMEKPKYLYTPYGTDTKLLEKKYDTAVSSENLEDYSLDFIYTGSYEKFMSSVHYAEAQKNDSVFNNFAAEENVYRNYVYNEYLQLPDNQDMKDIYTEFSDVIENAAARSSSAEYYADYDGRYTEIMYNCEDIYSTLCEIRSAISQNTEYTLSPGRTPATRDFTAYFLLENKKGYCSHYASAGIILARMCGIPARYAEGYIITGNDFEEAIYDYRGLYTVNIKDSRSHAWAEIYIDGLGWVPFEFTPGYEAGLIAAESEMSNPKVTVVMPPETTEAPPVTTEIPVNPEQPETTMITEITEESNGTSQNTDITEYIPAQTDTSDDDNNNPNIISKIINNKIIMGIIISIAGIIIVFIIVILVFLIKRKYVIAKRNAVFEKGSSNESALVAYHYIISLLNFEGIRNSSNMHHMKFAEYAENNSQYLQKGEFTEATAIALKSDLSEHKITKEESDMIINLAKRICSETEKNSNKKQKFYLRYILNLS
ncbi:MAG: transglutaminase family protein [Oscillospiraceae bacterium]